MGSFWPGLLSLILAPIGFLVAAVIARVWLEFIVVVFRIADYAKTIAETTKPNDYGVSPSLWRRWRSTPSSKQY